ncbi:hypothetical protein SUDANB95_02006 [Actinosynnema sp. ALI-1.44]
MKSRRRMASMALVGASLMTPLVALTGAQAAVGTLKVAGKVVLTSPADGKCYGISALNADSVENLTRTPAYLFEDSKCRVGEGIGSWQATYRLDPGLKLEPRMQAYHSVAFIRKA